MAVSDYVNQRKDVESARLSLEEIEKQWKQAETNAKEAEKRAKEAEMHMKEAEKRVSEEENFMRQYAEVLKEAQSGCADVVRRLEGEREKLDALINTQKTKLARYEEIIPL